MTDQQDHSTELGEYQGAVTRGVDELNELAEKAKEWQQHDVRRAAVAASAAMGQLARVLGGATELPECVWIGDLSGFRVESTTDDAVIGVAHRCGWGQELHPADWYLGNIVAKAQTHTDCRPWTEARPLHAVRSDDELGGLVRGDDSGYTVVPRVAFPPAAVRGVLVDVDGEETDRG